MKRRTWMIVVAGLVLLWMAPLFAAEEHEEEKPTELEQITVSARKVTLIKDEITEDRLKIPSMSGSVLDALSEEAGIQIRRDTLAGSDGSALRLRGFGETRLRITKDDVALNRDGSYGNGPVDWTILSGDGVEKIEIYRGAGPAKFGNTLGGVINIVSAKPTEDPSTKIRSSIGSLKTWDSSISHTWKAGPLGWALTAGHFETDGYLRNNTMDRDSISLLLTYDLPSQWQVGAGLDYSQRDCGMAVYNRPDSLYYNSGDPDADERSYGGPGIGSRLENGVTAWGDGSDVSSKNVNLTGFIEKTLDKGHFRLDYRLWNQDVTETYLDAADRSTVFYQRETEAEDNNWSLQARADYEMGKHLIEVGGETRKYGWGDQDVTVFVPSYFNGSIDFFTYVEEGFEGQPGIMQYHALYAQDTYSLNPALSVELGLRQEWFTADSVDPSAFGMDWETGVTNISESTLDPRMAVTYRPWKTGALCARFGITHRYPTSPEYFWWYLNNGTDLFNTDFNPEEAFQYELAYTQSMGEKVEMVLRGYYYDIEDYITSTSMPGLGRVYYNIGQVDIRGLEMGVSSKLPFGLRLWANLTLQRGDKEDDTFDTDNELSRQLPDFPEWMANAGLDYSLSKFRARIWMNYVDEREHPASESLETLNAYTLVQAYAAYRVLDTHMATLDLELSGQNLLDEDYQEKDGYPMAGSSIMGGVRIEF